MTQGQLIAGRYRRTALDYYSPGELTSFLPDDVEVEVKDNVGAIYFRSETWLIAMGTPATSAPQSIKVACQVKGGELSASLQLAVGVDVKNKVSYQATAIGFQLMVLTGDGWYRVHYTKLT